MPPRDAIPPPPAPSLARTGRELAGGVKLFDRLFCGDTPVSLEQLEAEAAADDPNTITVPAEVTACLTCAGAGMLGARGHEVSCPACGGGGLSR